MDVGAFATVALGVLLFGLVSRRLQRGVVTPPMAFTCLGLLLGATGLVVLETESTFAETLAELTLVLVLFTDATRINLSLLKEQYGLALRLLGVGLPLTVAAGTLAGALLFDASIWEVALLAAILAPTDAALGQAVVSSERVPVRVRQTLNVESGLNDGLALPAVLFFLSVVSVDAESAGMWVRFAFLQLLLAPVAGVLVGYVGGELVDRATRAGWMSPSFTKLSALALSLLAFASAELVGGNGFIAAFVAGLTLGNTKREVCHQLYEFAETEGQLLTLFVFLIFGAAMVGPALAEFSWRTPLYALLSLTVVRMLSVALSLVGAGLRPGTVLFLGWFGPRGIASILYGLLLLQGGVEGGDTLFHVVVSTVLLSTFLHGLTAVPLANLYGDQAEVMKGEANDEVMENAKVPELREVDEMPLRLPRG